MTVDFATLKPALAVVVATLTGLQPRDVEQQDGANSFVGKVKARYSLIGWASLGVDDSLMSRTDDTSQPFGSVPFGGASAPLVETVSGRRTFTLRIKIVCYDHTGGTEAETYLERARTRLRWRSITQALNTIGVGYDRVLSYGLLNDTTDDRISSTAYLDVAMSIHVRETDPTEYASIDNIDAPTIKVNQ